eukprot:m.346707 g.346707  ORF g.346707 m.346707 type:complete len:59 (-) comp16143_c2_seq1:1229-1405(-)
MEARRARAEQLKVLEKYLAGEQTVFLNHQGSQFKDTYDASVFERPRSCCQCYVRVDFH